MNEMSLPIMIFRHLLVSSSKRTAIFLEGIIYQIIINFCRVPSKIKIFQGDQVENGNILDIKHFCIFFYDMKDNLQNFYKEKWLQYLALVLID